MLCVRHQGVSAIVPDWKVHTLSKHAQVENLHKYPVCPTKPICELDLACLQHLTQWHQKREHHKGKPCFIPSGRFCLSAYTAKTNIFSSQ